MHATDAAAPLEQVSHEAFWQQHLDRCQASNLSKMAYCREHELAYHQMIYWQKRLDDSVDDSVPDRGSSKGNFVQVIVDNNNSHPPSLRLTLPNGLVISGITDSTVNLIKPLLSHL